MSRDIVAEIVRRALEPQSALAGDVAPGESPIEERLRQLQESLESTRERLARRGLELARLREQVSGYTSVVDESHRRLKAIELQAWALREPARTPAPQTVVRAAPQPQPRPEAQPLPAPRPMPQAATPSLIAHWAPTLSFACVAAIVAAFAATHLRPARSELRIDAVPPPFVDAVPQSAGALSTVADEADKAEILSLVYAYVPPGGTRDLKDLLGPQLDAAPDSPWTFASVDAKTTLVSFRPRGDDAPAYEFVVDPASKLVSPSPETLRNLATTTLASAR